MEAGGGDGGATGISVIGGILELDGELRECPGLGGLGGGDGGDEGEDGVTTIALGGTGLRGDRLPGIVSNGLGGSLAVGFWWGKD